MDARLRRLYAGLIDTYASSNMYIIGSISEYIQEWTEINMAAGGNMQSGALQYLTESWQSLVVTFLNEVSSLERLLSELGKDRSSFQLEQVYRDIAAGLHSRKLLLNKVAKAGAPLSTLEIDRLRNLSFEYDRLRENLTASVTAMSELLKKLADSSASDIQKS